jgi:hypothetical protein
MNAPHPAIRARSLANVLADLKEAHDDSQTALNDYLDAPVGSQELRDADDRRTEAETRAEDLRQEFAQRFVECTGLTWKQIEQAVSEAVL